MRQTETQAYVLLIYLYSLIMWLHSFPQWSIRWRDGAERPTRLIAQFALESCYWSRFNSSWWKMIPIGYGFVQKEFCPSVVLALMCMNDFLFPPRFLPSAGFKRSLTGTAINSFTFFTGVLVEFFLLVCKSVQTRSLIRVVTRNFGDVIPPFQVLTDADSQVGEIGYFSKCDPLELIV